MKLKQQLILSDRYKYKAPYSMKPEFIIIHNTSNDAKAANEIAYMTRNNNYTSFHIAVDDVEAIQAIPFNRNSFSAGDGSNGKGNRRGIAIEICYSKSGGVRFDKAERNAAKVAADILKQYGWNISHIKRHKDFSGKDCPKLTMKLGWQRWLNLVSKELGASTGVTTGGSSTVASNIYYGVGSPHNTKSGVQKLQKDLVLLGHSVGSYGANGVMGNDTKNAIISFQKANGLTQDGFAGQATLNKIKELIDEKNKPKPAPAPTPVSSRVWYSMDKKDNNRSGVIQLQKNLISLGFSVGSYGANGIFGKDTDAAVKDFQRANKLTVDGSAGQATLNKIEELIAIKNKPKPIVPKPNPPSKSDGLYKVQVGAYANKDNADKLLKDLESKGLKGFIKKE